MKKKLLLAITLLTGIATTMTAETQRPMLQQGKTWWYIYHHFEDRETTSDPQNYYDFFDESQYPVSYTLRGDTIIDGCSYMKMYRQDLQGRRYHGAFREDADGRVYVYDYQGDKKDYLLIDFTMQYDNGFFKDVVPVVSTIKVGEQAYRRYKYQATRPDGTTYELGFTGVEGVGFEGFGLVHDLFAPESDCICDYESFDYVVDNDWNIFSAADFMKGPEIQLTTDEKQLVASNNDFALRLFRQARRNESMLLSPLSITFALGMQNNGATGQTQQEINQVLGFGNATDGAPLTSEQGADALNAYCYKLLNGLRQADEHTKLLIGNTIFVNEGLGYYLQDGFVQKVNDYYEAQPQGRDFADGETRDAINQWGSDHTNGMIKEVLTKDEFTPLAANYLLNAIYFKGGWVNKFDKRETRDEAFNGGDKIPMMHQHEEFSYEENDLYQAVTLPYGNDAFRMTVFLPREGKTINDVLNKMSGSNWQMKGGSYMVDLKLPSFETETNQNLVKIMSDLGMPSAFDRSKAEFPYICNYPLYIAMMKQVAKIKVDEEGTEAAAITVIDNETTGIPQYEYATFYANRPFLYVISEKSTSAILFIGQYMGNTATAIRDTSRETAKATATESPVYDLQGRQKKSRPLPSGLYISNGRKIVVY